ncbi:peptidoglycan-binding protein [Dactylosporangium sp. NPDC051541]|uniref:peptidoglycan-binding protein n=1 Tax=Dactylosporangium sp. NPDC051541 TaxID=3363977 RepID=UPI0037B4AA59
MSRTTKVVTGVALVGVAGVAALVAKQQLSHSDAPAEPTAVSTSTAGVVRKTISERQFVIGTLGYAESYVVTGSGQGTLTWVPPLGTVVNAGDAAFEVDGKRVILLYGTRPAWRDFTSGMTDGVDVEQLETNLRNLGYGDGVTVDQKFTNATYNAIRRWQQDRHVTVTGSLPLGSVTFMPGTIRISGHELKLGTQVGPGATVEYATSNQPAVNINASTQQLGWIKVGDTVLVTLPDNKPRDGKVSAIGATTTTTGSGSGGNAGASQTTVPVTVRVDGEVTGFVDQATVRVWVIRATHDNVLTVPIAALNSVSDGKYEVIVVDGTATRRVPVTTGLFDDLAGTAEISGDGLSEGQKVQVPRDDT